MSSITMYVRKVSDAAPRSPDPSITDDTAFGRTTGLGLYDGGLRGDRLAALPVLSHVEQLIHDQDCDQQHQHS